MKVTILGCGGAGGVPTVAWGWGECDPINSRNRRLRPSILIEKGKTRVLIDTSPDLREQLLEARINTLSGVVYTHAHADHTHGLDDLREVNRAMHAPLNIWADELTLSELRHRFSYAFEGLAPEQRIFRPWLIPNSINPPKPFNIHSLQFKPFVQDHGYMKTLGFRIDNFAYSTDLVRLPDAAKASLQGLDVWIVGALTTDNEHESHASLDKAFSWIKELKPKRAVITHMGVGLDYEAVRNHCPSGVEPGYDGLCVRI
ncbi:MAG: MBL fold metallo-hydrolase [Rhodospirillaceae bacterium]